MLNDQIADLAAPPVNWRPSDLPTLRAAYSDRTAALMAYLAGFAYDKSIEVPMLKSAPEQLKAFGFDRFQAFHNGLTNGWAYVAVSNDIIVLSFRGTQSKEDWQTDFEATLTHPEDTNERLLVHSGFYRAFKTLADGADGLKAAVAKIKDDTKDKNLPVYITGHSLGGALAQIAAAVLGDDRVAACYTFGSPRVGNSYFDLWVKVPSYRLVNASDIVPQLPWPISYRHSGDPRFLPEKVDASPYRYQPDPGTRAIQLGEGIFKFFQAGSVLLIADHAIGEYERKLNQIAAIRTQQT
jgi:triacylglycerol lipase